MDWPCQNFNHGPTRKQPRLYRNYIICEIGGGVPQKVIFAKFCMTKGGGGVKQKVTKHDKTWEGGGAADVRKSRRCVD